MEVGAQDIEQIFERLSAQYLAKIAEERKKADDLQLVTLNNTLREWTGKFSQHANASHANESNETDLLKEALSEAKDRQGKIITVIF